MAAIEDRPCDVSAIVDRLREMVDTFCLGPSTACIVDAATDRRIPAIRLSDGNLVQLGYGKQQRRIWTAETSRTSAIAESISSDKDLTRRLLQSCGVPVPEGRIVDDPEDAWGAAQDVGLPVVVKPSDANHGRGVSTDLNTRAEIEAAYRLAEQEGSEVIVERFVRGDEHRLLVVGGKLVAATKGEVATVTGDGVSTVTELIDRQLNTDPRRGEHEDFPLSLITYEEDPTVLLVLERQGYGPDSVPPQGKTVLVQSRGNLAFDCTDKVHAGVAQAAALAARVVGLDIAGIDLVAEDISRPLEEQGGAIVEVNAGPGLLMHLKPAEGEPRPVGRAIVDHLFPEVEDGRIPVIGICGSHGGAEAARLLARMLQLHGSYAGTACADGLYLSDRRIDTGDCTNWESARRVLLNPSVEVAVVESSAHTILAEGLAYDRCKIGVVTGIAADASLADFYIEDVDQMATVIRTQIDVVLADGVAVLNGADPRVTDLARLSDGEVMLFGVPADMPTLATHLAAGGRAVLARDGRLILATGTQETALSALPKGCAGHRLDGMLAAVGAGWALGLPAELIRAGLAASDLPGAANQTN
jgi:cyanophycin synthetase